MVSTGTSAPSGIPHITASYVVPVILAAVGTAVLYTLTMLVPYVVNDLDRLTLDELASGRHDPKDLWPQGWLAGLTQLGAFAAILAMLVVPWVGGVWAAVCIVLGVLQRQRVIAAVAVVALAVCGGLAVYALAPLNTALMTWRMD